MTDKELVRNNMKEMLRNLPRREKETLCGLLTEKIISHTSFFHSDLILIFYPLHNEINTIPIIEYSLKHHKRVALPIMEEDQINFYEIGQDYEKKLVKNCFGIKEPKLSNQRILLDEFSNALLIVPGLAFSTEKQRLGRGKGYYDKFLQKFRNMVVSVGVCFDFQLLNSIPTGKHDEKVDYIITDRRII